jgi:divinyl chlorophyllide a 8-vinyl-reductase
MTTNTSVPDLPTAKRVLMLGATGTAGRATARALARDGHQVVCLVRDATVASDLAVLRGMTLREADLQETGQMEAVLAADGPFDAIVSCLASRTGTPADAWAIDYGVHSALLKSAQAAGIRQFVLLSAICVQKPDLAFQRAKLAFEAELTRSGLTYSIVRPTAFFKSLSGQVERLRAGKPFLIFGDGTLTACTPISDRDLGTFIAECLTDPARQDAILPIGGPGPALTAREQGLLLFEALGLAPKFRSVPVALLDTIIAVTGALGRVSRSIAEKSELARIGRYYATESMLVRDPATGRYSREATPSAGRDTLAEHYARLARGEVTADLREHAVF